MTNAPLKKVKLQNLVDLILQNAKTLNTLNEAIDKARKAKDKQAYKQALKIWNESYNSLAYPGGIAQGLALLNAGEPYAVDTAIAFLLADPIFLRSGYIKQSIARTLKKLPLTQVQIEQVQDFLIVAIERDTHREFREYCRLAAKCTDDELRKKVKKIIETSDNEQHVKQAQWLYDYIKGY